MKPPSVYKAPAYAEPTVGRMTYDSDMTLLHKSQSSAPVDLSALVPSNGVAMKNNGTDSAHFYNPQRRHVDSQKLPTSPGSFVSMAETRSFDLGNVDQESNAYDGSTLTKMKYEDTNDFDLRLKHLQNKQQKGETDGSIKKAFTTLAKPFTKKKDPYPNLEYLETSGEQGAKYPLNAGIVENQQRERERNENGFLARTGKFFSGLLFCFGSTPAAAVPLPETEFGMNAGFDPNHVSFAPVVSPNGAFPPVPFSAPQFNMNNLVMGAPSGLGSNAKNNTGAAPLVSPKPSNPLFARPTTMASRDGSIMIPRAQDSQKFAKALAQQPRTQQPSFQFQDETDLREESILVPGAMVETIKQKNQEHFKSPKKNMANQVHMQPVAVPIAKQSIDEHEQEQSGKKVKKRKKGKRKGNNEHNNSATEVPITTPRKANNEHNNSATEVPIMAPRKDSAQSPVSAENQTEKTTGSVPLPFPMPKPRQEQFSFVGQANVNKTAPPVVGTGTRVMDLSVLASPGKFRAPSPPAEKKENTPIPTAGNNDDDIMNILASGAVMRKNNNKKDKAPSQPNSFFNDPDNL